MAFEVGGDLVTVVDGLRASHAARCDAADQKDSRLFSQHRVDR